MVMSALFGTTGVILVFLPRWLEVERHLSGAEIGIIISLAQFARLITGPLIAYRADRASDRAAPLKIIAFAAVFAYAAFFLVAQGFWQLLILGFVALTLTQSMTPLIEAATLRASAHGKISYVSPLAEALLDARVGKTVLWRRPVGNLQLTVEAIDYPED